MINPCLKKTIIAITVFLLVACGGGGSDSHFPTYDAFGPPEKVVIAGYSGDIMEPFFSRDERFLFFNDNEISPGPPLVNTKNLHYARYDSLTDTFTYAGEVGPGINEPGTVQGVPTMDSGNNFYFVDTKFYDPLGTPPVYITLFSGTWDGSTVSGITPVIGLDYPVPGFLNFDLEVSPDGQTIWFNDGYFTGGTFPDAAEIKYATYNPGTGLFVRAPDVDTIMANVNTSTYLEYAPAISGDGLELFFTRLDPGSMDARIYRATRPGTSSPFGPAQLVSAIPGFAEGATFSQDEKRIYYHWRNPAGVPPTFELYRVTRP